ncbi:MAG: hypothetical protein ABIS86_07590 [Streptosporangiaceae bacterium]
MRPGPVVLALTGVFLIYLAAPNIGPSLRAARADGTVGVFTAQRLDCLQHPGHESCSWTGEFRSADGARRPEVSLYGSGRDSLRVGESTTAVDVGRASRVYGPEGSHEWIATALLLLTGVLLLVFAIRRPRRRVRPVRVEEPVRAEVAER